MEEKRIWVSRDLITLDIYCRVFKFLYVFALFEIIVIPILFLGFRYTRPKMDCISWINNPQLEVS